MIQTLVGAKNNGSAKILFNEKKFQTFNLVLSHSNEISDKYQMQVNETYDNITVCLYIYTNVTAHRHIGILKWKMEQEEEHELQQINSTEWIEIKIEML